MKEIYGNYVGNSFDGELQADFKFIQFETNYRRFFPSDLNAVLLDIGIGRGEMLSSMKRWGFVNSAGVDISESTVNHCLDLGLECELTDDTAAWLRQRPDSFDLITLIDVLEHVRKEDIPGFLSSIRDSLKDKGRLIIQVPNMQAPESYLHRYNDITHEVGFTEHSLAQILISSGFALFDFHPFEDTVTRNPKELVRILLRSMYWHYITIIRHINGNLRTGILSPILFAVVDKTLRHVKPK